MIGRPYLFLDDGGAASGVHLSDEIPETLGSSGGGSAAGRCRFSHTGRLQSEDALSVIWMEMNHLTGVGSEKKERLGVKITGQTGRVARRPTKRKIKGLILSTVGFPPPPFFFLKKVRESTVFLSFFLPGGCKQSSCFPTFFLLIVNHARLLRTSPCGAVKG